MLTRVATDVDSILNMSAEHSLELNIEFPIKELL